MMDLRSVPRSLAARTFRPTVEWLEQRNCPSTSTMDQMVPPPPMPAMVGPMPAPDYVAPTQTLNSGNLPPSLQLFIDQLDQRRICLYGTVQDENPAGLLVQFHGQFAGTAVTGADGSFSIIAEASGLGEISAIAMDDLQQGSQLATVQVSSKDPTIVDFQAIRMLDNTWVFTGRVMDESPAGLSVVFSGLPQLEGTTVTVSEDGTFTLSVELPEGTVGAVSAQTTDWYNLVSELASTFVNAA